MPPSISSAHGASWWEQDDPGCGPTDKEKFEVSSSYGCASKKLYSNSQTSTSQKIYSSRSHISDEEKVQKVSPPRRKASKEEKSEKLVLPRKESKESEIRVPNFKQQIASKYNSSVVGYKQFEPENHSEGKIIEILEVCHLHGATSLLLDPVFQVLSAVFLFP